MDRYTIHCTEEQTKKAFELGAPIVILPNYEEFKGFPFVRCKNGYEYPCQIPTAEQMKGWLRTKNIFISICHNNNGYGTWIKTITPSEDISGLIGYYESEPQATLAAIDAALDYLAKNKDRYE